MATDTSFFFSTGGGEVSHAGKFFASITVQLANNVPSLRKHIYNAITKLEEVASRSLRDQRCQLVICLLSRLGSSTSTFIADRGWRCGALFSQ
jgi:hypothetical protein